MDGKKGQIDIQTIMGIIFLVLGFFASLIVFLGFFLKNSDLLFIGATVLGLISLVIPILEKVMLR